MQRIVILTFISVLLVFAAPGQAANVSISGFAFQPSSITINVGESVTWTNQDQASHTATSTTGVWDSSTINNGGSFSRAFNTAGTFAYRCTIHPSMTGTVVVQTSYATPYSTPYATPYTYQTPYLTPYSTPYQTPYTTPNSYQTPYITPNVYNYQYQTPYPTPSTYSYQTPYNTPYVTPATTPLSVFLPDGALVKDGKTIYVIENGTKRGFTNMEALRGLGYKLSNAVSADTSNISEGTAISTKNIRHPRGSVVKDKGTVYFLGTELRYPFPSGAVFLSWGNKFKDVVPANSFDLAMPLGPIVQEKQ